MPGRNGNGGNGRDGEAPGTPSHDGGVLALVSSSLVSMREGLDRQLASLQASLLSSTRATLDEQVELFQQVIRMSNDMLRDASANMERASTLILDHLQRHDHEIAAIKERLDAVEARQAEAARPEP